MKKNSLKHKIWIYLSIFSLLILCFIWFLQILSLNTFYELSKEKEIKNIANKILKESSMPYYNDILDRLSFEKDVCIEITTNNNISYSTDSASRGCLNNNSMQANNYKLDFMKSEKTSVMYKLLNPRFNNKSLIYGIKLKNNTYAFISTSLEPISSTVTLLQRQLILIVIIVLMIAFFIAYTISKKISNPIEKINEHSKEISKGNYNVVFDINSNITELQNLEKTLNNMANELSKTENLRRELLANVSHDLKTPLTLIKANAEMVQDLTYKNKEKRDKNLNTIIDEVERLNLLVEDILDLSKMQSNAIKLNLERFNINDIIKSIIIRFDILCEKNGYKINYDGFDAYVIADIKKIEQVIYNLINNAINYTGKDKRIFINLIKNNDLIIVEVMDTGKGIDSKDIDYIWDKYYKVDKKYKRVTYGTGLGLSIVKNILNMHNFKYGVESKKGKGTKFYFEIKSEL